ncbi:MAG: glycosyltransferase family 39 protein [Anaerolineales bacterium]|nr:glycosyltransferase family 39 protein [Anaerolineales bacterium]
MNTKSRFFISTFFILWLTVLLAVFFVVQKPVWGNVVHGLGRLASTLSIWILFVFSSIGLGYFIFDRFIKIDSISPYQRIIFSTGFGMGLFGLLGFVFAVTDLGNQWFLLAILIIVFYMTWRMYISIIKKDFQSSFEILFRSIKYSPRWVPILFIIIFIFSFLLALAPPIEAFDGLLYHLTVPAWWLRDGGVQLVDLHPYWYPSLLEGMFVFPLAFHLDSTPQLLHGTFALLCFGILFGWTQELFGFRAAWWSVAMFISMPSIPWVAAWAYTDFGLTFYTLGTLFALTKWSKDSSSTAWLIIAGIFCGFAVGIKYTSLALPIAGCIILIWRLRSEIKQLHKNLGTFVGFALLSGGIWYLRNLIWTKNPFYPFVFGGPYWDTFRADWYANTGTGIGLDLVELFLLPLSTTLGLRDETFFDGRIGPFYIILLPLFLSVLWKIYKTLDKKSGNVFVFVLFGFLSISLWVIGVMQTSNLVQTRLLFPGLITLLPLFGKSILHLESFQTPKLKLKFVFSTLMALTIFVFTLDFTLLVLVRNPIMAAIGIESRQAYTQRFNPSYAQLLSLAEQTPPDAYIYLINEPRSYGINRLVVADPNNDHVAHSFYLYPTNEELMSAWKQAGYTHILIRMYLFDSEKENQHLSPRFDELRQMLIEINRTEEYILYQIP